MRIVSIDIETAPAHARVWRTGQQFVSLDQIVQPPQMLCYAARFRDRKRTEFYSEWGDGREEMVRQVHRILDEADAVLHYNGKRFDVPWLRTEMQLLGLTPPSPFAQIDLYQQTKQFYLVSHKLQHVSTHLAKVEGKISTGGFGLWTAVEAGDPAAQRLMRRYNIRDVDVLWEVYDALEPWLKLPNANLYVKTADGRPVCVGCGKLEALQRRGVERLRTGSYRRLWCNPQVGGCGKWSREVHRLDGASVVEVSV